MQLQGHFQCCRVEVPAVTHSHMCAEMNSQRGRGDLVGKAQRWAFSRLQQHLPFAITSNQHQQLVTSDSPFDVPCNYPVLHRAASATITPTNAPPRRLLQCAGMSGARCCQFGTADHDTVLFMREHNPMQQTISNPACASCGSAECLLRGGTAQEIRNGKSERLLARIALIGSNTATDERRLFVYGAVTLSPWFQIAASASLN